MEEVKSHKKVVKVNILDSEEEVAIELAKYVANLSQKFVSERGAFTVVLSGGYLIDTLRKLVGPPYVDSIDWSKWHVFWVDERVVPRDHPDSNYKLAFDGFMSKDLRSCAASSHWTWKVEDKAMLAVRLNQVSAIPKLSSKFKAKSSMAEVKSSQKDSPNVNIFDSEEQVAFELAKYTANLSDKFVRERGAFTVVVSGGSLIKSLRKLLDKPYVDSIDWSKWHVFWVDERVVPKDHPDSNYKLAYDGFLSKVPIPPGQVYAINDALPTEAAADDYETGLKQLVKTNIIATSSTSGFPKFDVMLLGMGPDGHVASLFPGHPLVKENKRWVTSIKDSPKPPPERITFTFPVINSSASIALVVCGSGKAAVVKTALGENQSSDLLPVQMVSPEGELKWFLDKEAAGML
ncbi:probable 6-phosphogluconolactonase 4, chloroplastic isoform X2 [Beta vulgaris subsp. vulgaris]|uniref:probable 6-phosphogluconolactonase 4, chloroplastic isoform X2 n=1 Tax=Beta vulgaris subsp. vulgaris TaxID=3555 RepID=UPI00053FDE1D|nr:probable 6-phosphogluconolactonase 4, chloroplastic isoform X2 [Beta vulgaris subsp. vulgaris]